MPAAAAPELPLPHRDPLGRTKYRERDWPTLTLGTLALPEGPVRLTIESLVMPGGQVMELKHVELERRTGGPRASRPPGRPRCPRAAAPGLGRPGRPCGNARRRAA